MSCSGLLVPFLIGLAAGVGCTFFGCVICSIFRG